jgi:hypothetical protein
MSVRLLPKLTLIGCCSILAIGCSAEKPQAPTSSKPVSAQSSQPQYVSDPTCCGFAEGPGSQGLDLAWHTFTGDGRYRLARKDDFKSGARAFGSDDPLNSVFAYCWGRLRYESHANQTYDLAAIVVDTHRTDDARFGLVIFSSPRDGDGTYQPYWLYRARDLSRTVVWTGSGDLMVADYRDDGSRDVSYVQWDARHKQFVATTSRPKPT